MTKALGYAAMFTPGFYSLIPQIAYSASRYQQYKFMALVKQESTIVLGLKGIEKLSEADAEKAIQNMGAHEFGHLLGLKANSPTDSDALSEKTPFTNDTVVLPSDRDIQTLRELYERPPNIILNVQ
jgi:predicted Zn-dependent protease